MSYLYQLSSSELKEFKKINHEIAIKVESYTTKDFISSFSIDQQPIEKKIESSPIFQFNFISNKEITSFEINLLKANLFKLISLSTSSLKNIYIVPAKKDDFTSCTDVYESLDKKILSKKWKFRIFSSFQWDEVNYILEKKTDTIGLDLKNNFHFSNIRLKFDKYKGSFEVPLSSDYKISASFILLLIAQVPFDFFKYNSLDSRINQIIQEIIKTSKLKNNYIFQGLYEIKEDEVDVLKKKEFEKKIEIEQEEFIRKKKEKELLTKENKELEDKKKKIEEKQILLVKTISATPLSEEKKINLENEIKKREEELEKEKAQIEKDREKRIEEDKKTTENKKVELVNIQDKINQVEKKLSTSSEFTGVSGISFGERIIPSYTPLKSVVPPVGLSSQERLSFHQTIQPSVSSIITPPGLPKRPPPSKPTIPAAAAPPTTSTIGPPPKSTKTEEIPAVETKKKGEERETETETALPIRKTLQQWQSDLPQGWSFEPELDPYRNAAMRYDALVGWSQLDPNEFNFDTDPELLNDIAKQTRLMGIEKDFLSSEEIGENVKENYILHKYLTYASLIYKSNFFDPIVDHPTMPYSIKIKFLQLLQLFYTISRRLSRPPDLPDLIVENFFELEKRIFREDMPLTFYLHKEDWKLLEKEINEDMGHLEYFKKTKLRIPKESKAGAMTEVQKETPSTILSGTTSTTPNIPSKAQPTVRSKPESIQIEKQIEKEPSKIVPISEKSEEKKMEVSKKRSFEEWEKDLPTNYEDPIKNAKMQKNSLYIFGEKTTHEIPDDLLEDEKIRFELNAKEKYYLKEDENISDEKKQKYIITKYEAYAILEGENAIDLFEPYTENEVLPYSTKIKVLQLLQFAWNNLIKEETKEEQRYFDLFALFSLWEINFKNLMLENDKDWNKLNVITQNIHTQMERIIKNMYTKRTLEEWEEDLPRANNSEYVYAKMRYNALALVFTPLETIPVPTKEEDKRFEEDKNLQDELNVAEQKFLADPNRKEKEKENYVLQQYISEAKRNDIDELEFWLSQIMPYSTKIKVMSLEYLFYVTMRIYNNNLVSRDISPEQHKKVVKLYEDWKRECKPFIPYYEWDKLDDLATDTLKKLKEIFGPALLLPTKVKPSETGKTIQTEMTEAKKQPPLVLMPKIEKSEEKTSPKPKYTKRSFEEWEKDLPPNFQDPILNAQMQKNTLGIFNEETRRITYEQLQDLNTRKELAEKEKYYLEKDEDISDEQKENYVVKKYANYAVLASPQAIAFLTPYIENKDLPYSTKIKVLHFVQFFSENVTKPEILLENKDKDLGDLFSIWEFYFKKVIPSRDWKTIEKLTQNIFKEMQKIIVQATPKRSLEEWEQDLPQGNTDQSIVARMRYNALLATSFEDFPVISEETERKFEEEQTQRELLVKEKEFLGDSKVSVKEKQNFILREYLFEAKRFQNGNMQTLVLFPLPYSPKITILRFIHFYLVRVNSMTFQQQVKARVVYKNWIHELFIYVKPQEWDKLETFLSDMDKIKKTLFIS